MKMLKKIFGVATVYVAFGSMSLRADFEQDLLSVCKKCEVDPAGVSISLESYKFLYQDFKGKVVVKMRKLHNLRLQENKIVDDDRVSCPGKSEIGMLKFAEWLRVQVKNYEMQAKEIDFWNDAVKHGCRDAFMRRMRNFGFACVRFCVGEKMLGSKEKVMDEVAEYFPSLVDEYTVFEVFCESLCKTAKLLDSQEYIDGIYNLCSMVLKRAESCRLHLEKLSDGDFCKINMFLKNVKNDTNALREDREIRQKIDELKEQKEMLSSELQKEEENLEYFEIWQEKLPTIASVKYDKSGKIVSARPNLPENKEDVDLGVWSYNEFRFLPFEVKKLRNTKISFEAEITELEAKLHIKDCKLTEDVRAFRGYNACLKFFWYLFRRMENDLKNTFEEDYDSIVEIFMKRRCDSFDGAVVNGFGKSKNLLHAMKVMHAGKVVTKESFLNMEKEGKTALFDTKFVLYDESNTINQIKFMPDDEEFEPIDQIDCVNKSAFK